MKNLQRINIKLRHLGGTWQLKYLRDFIPILLPFHWLNYLNGVMASGAGVSEAAERNIKGDCNNV